MQVEPLLLVQDLVSHYGRIEVVHRVSLEVHAGELVAIVGANGAGKTTLLRVLSGVQPLTSGAVHFSGQDISHWPAHRIVGLGIGQVPEGRQLFAPLSVHDNLLLGAYLHRRDRRWVEHEIERVYARFPLLADKRHQPAGTLSGGQQQMVAIGRALLGRPRLLLLDEPSMGLAPLLVEEIFSVVLELNAAGVTIVLVEQNARAALAIAHRGYVLETGRIVLSGPAAGLLDNDAVRKAYLGH